MTDNRGLTLLEVLVAVFVLGIVALPLLNIFSYNTALIKKVDNIGDTTYAGQAVMEQLYPLNYGDLFGKTSPTTYASKSVSITRYPYGSFNNLVSGTACYAHLILKSDGAIFTSPGGTMTTLSSVPSTVTVNPSQAVIGSTACNLDKPAGSNLILIVNAGSSPISSLTINMGGNGACVLYALSADDAKKQTIAISGATASKEYRKFNTKTGAEADPIPSYMMVNAVCKVLSASGTVESSVQDVLQVSLQ